MPVVGRVRVGPTSLAGPIEPAIEFFDLRLQINGLPWRAPMHAAQPTNVGELVGREIPVVRLRDQRVFYGKIVILRASRQVFGIPAPGPVTRVVDLANVAVVQTLFGGEDLEIRHAGETPVRKIGGKPSSLRKLSTAFGLSEPAVGSSE